jgi:hypothetical protein
MVVTANKEVIDNCLLRNQVKELHTSMNNRAKKKDTRREHLQKGGVLSVKDGQQMVLDRQGRTKKQAERATQAERAAHASQADRAMIIPQADGTRATQAGEAIQASQAGGVMAMS